MPTSSGTQTGLPPGVNFNPQFQVVTKLPRGLLNVIQHQFRMIETWLRPLTEESAKSNKELKELRATLDGVVLSYKNAMRELEQMRRQGDAAE
jgi:hypothetical protein